MKPNISARAHIDYKGKVIIGNHTMISHDVEIITHHHNESKYRWTKKRESKEVLLGIDIGKHVFIGLGAIILASCRSIGDNSIIGAGSVVTKDVPANEVWVGNPARKIRERKIVKGKDVLWTK